MTRSAVKAALALALLAAPALARQDDGFVPRVEPASDEGRAAMSRFELADGLSISLFAAEPMLANPVCLYVDDRGQAWVAETFRHHAGVTDMREHMDWLDIELANTTVEGRVEMFRTAVGDELTAKYGTAEERVRLIRDTDGDGRADEAIVFADGFHDPADGIGAGLLVNGGDVYYTCIPHLWLLRDDDGDGSAEVRRPLSSGYGVHVALLGHDLHGLRIGPDGRLYFSCGDRGFHVQMRGRTIAHPHTGAVLRCNLDGTDLEVYATGLRNPQELAFDDAGNLFTCDNNSDGGDRARVVQVVEGSETGWRFAFQYVTRPVARGIWNDEKLWHPAHAGQAAYILPPIANLADGPSGFTRYPFDRGDERWAGRFFLCDFRGTPTLSGIHCFELRPKGAGFELGEVTRPVWGTLATDADFGPEGDLWFTDWVEGWNQTGKGRVYRVRGLVDEARGAESAELLAAGSGGLADERLVELLDHGDQRVRLGAELELAGRAKRSDAARALLGDAARAGSLRARRQAIWGLGIVARENSLDTAELLALATDPEPELRAQALRVLGDLGAADAAALLARGLADADPRVRMYAALGLHRVGDERAVEPLFQLARATGDSDPVLRHAAILGLVGCASPERLVAAADDASVDARLAAVVALRRKAHAGVARFLDDADGLVVTEAARAIHDVPIPGAAPALAALLERPGAGERALVRRALAAARELGQLDALVRFAARDDARAEHRAEALDMLTDWSAPSGRDPITGEWRPIAPRSDARVPELLRELRPAVVHAPAEVTEAWVRLVERYTVLDQAHQLGLWFVDAERPLSTRRALFRAVAHLRGDSFPSVLAAALHDPAGALRAAALEVLPTVDQDGALPLFRGVLKAGELAEQRAVLAALGRMGTPAAQELLGELLSEKFRVGLMPEELVLDFVLAVESGGSEYQHRTMKTALNARRPFHGELTDWQHSLFGGDARRGERLFEESAELTCLRCHPGGEEAGKGVGPDLRGVGRRLTRRQIMESIAQPNARISPGYESFLLRLKDETVVAGRILSEDDRLVTLINADGEVLEIDRREIELRRPDLSAMPEGLTQYLDRLQMRDLVEYVATL